MKTPLNNNDLLKNISYEKSLELVASQIISELVTEDDPPYEEKLHKKNKIYDKPSFGKVDCPVDENAFYKSICYWFIIFYRDPEDEQKGMSVATVQTIYIFSRKADPLSYENPQKPPKENIFIEYLIELKNRITNYTKLAELVDINISNYPEILRIGQSKNDCYKTIKEFKKDINVVEIMGVINLAWEYCCQKEKMYLVNKFLSEEKLS
jgi:hypothetical protein